ncbi:calcium:proton exchanger [Clostridium sp. E02]|uniref:calcium:proton exchanger n=1 Tax=Clostridium sp. E02 TaxID=2487134 RepID=UPI000F524E46|nr:calcium:proton exchanger [Clostridium sp. E02]
MRKPKKVSYIRKSFAKGSFLSLGLAIGALVLGIVGIISSVITAGQAQMNVGAVCFCSLLISFFSLFYGVFSFFEREKKYILTKIGISIDAVLILFWAVLIIIGLKG